MRNPQPTRPYYSPDHYRAHPNPSPNPRVQEIESYPLSTGGRVRVTKLGREYQFNRLYSDGYTPPDVTMRLTKAQAMKMLADAIRDDVMEQNPVGARQMTLEEGGPRSNP